MYSLLSYFEDRYMPSNLVIPNSSVLLSFCKNKIITAYLIANPMPYLSQLPSQVSPFFFWCTCENPDINSSYVFALRR